MVVRVQESELSGLRDAHQPAALLPYLGAVWERRRYIRYVASSELRGKHMDSVLGNLWHLLNPAIQIGIYYVIFGRLLKVDRGVDNFLAFLAVGIFVFQFTQRSTMSGTKAVVGNMGLIRAINFPRAVLPLSSTLAETLTAVPAFGVMLFVAFATGEPVALRWLLVIPLFVCQAILNTGFAMVAARATAHVRDVQQLLPFVFRILFYGSGVIFSAEAYATGSAEWLFVLNPVYEVVTMTRWAVLGGDLDGRLAIALAIWTFCGTAFGLLWFRAGEASYGRE